MKNLMLLCFVLLMAACSNSKKIGKTNKTATKSTTTAQTKPCEKAVSFGDIEICLPTVAGMTECYQHPKVKPIADEYEAAMNTVLAYYIQDSIYKKLDQSEEIVQSSYFKIYSTDQLQGIPVKREDLGEISKGVEVMFTAGEWDNVKNSIEDKLEGLEVGQPLLLEKYKPNPDVQTYAFVMKFNVAEGLAYEMLTVMDLIRVKERIIWLALYYPYDGEVSTKAAKKLNETIITKLMGMN